MAKRIILMYISEVSGHHSATIAIEAAIKKLKPDAEILNINAFNYTNPISEKIINRIYMSVIKTAPKIWEYLYYNPKVVKQLENLKKKIHKANSPKLKALFDKFKPDAVLCTQAFPCGMVADYKTTYQSSLPLIAVLTDYIPHAYWLYDEVNYYITPSEDVASRLKAKGIPEEKIKPLGIPFNPKFNEPLDKNTVIKKLGLNGSIPTILIMGGGQGLGPIQTIIKSLNKVKNDIQQIIVTGTNKKLYNKLKKKTHKLKKKTILFGYVNNIHELMTASDFIVTKPGGVTTSEMLTKNLAMLIVKPLPGQESNNADYLTQKQAAIRIDKPKDITAVVEELLNEPKKIQSLKLNAAKISKPSASLDIARLLLKAAE